jgi:hypothetical protein
VPDIVTVMADDDVAREALLRRTAERRGLTLLKSPQPDPSAGDYGTFMLVETDAEVVKVSGSPAGFGLDLDDVEEILGRKSR